MEDTLQFKISSALKDLVGKDLITSDNVAIFELVKTHTMRMQTMLSSLFQKTKSLLPIMVKVCLILI